MVRILKSQVLGAAQRLVRAPYHPAFLNDVQKLKVLLFIERLEQVVGLRRREYFAVYVRIFGQDEVQGEDTDFRNGVREMAG